MQEIEELANYEKYYSTLYSILFKIEGLREAIVLTFLYFSAREERKKNARASKLPTLDFTVLLKRFS